MNSRATKYLVLLALALFVFIFFFERRTTVTGEAAKPVRFLPDLNPTAVTGVQVHALNQVEFFVERKTEGWQLTRPFAANAQDKSIENLLQILAQLKWHTRLTAQDLKDRINAGREFGFEPPVFAVEIKQSGQTIAFKLGGRTALGDEVFVQVDGKSEIYVVDANLLRLIPRNANDWRDPSLVNLKNLTFDRLTIANGAKILELQRDATTKLWRITRPLEARADNPRINDLLTQLQNYRVTQFVTDDPKADLESFGLQPPELELALGQNTNVVLALQFGKSPTNKTDQVLVRRAGQSGVGLIAKEQLAPWHGSPEDFRDRRLVDLAATQFDQIEARGAGSFILERTTNNLWRVTSPEDLAADTALVRDWLGALGGLQATQFVKSVVTEPDLPNYGLAPSAVQFILRDGATNMAELHFSAPQSDGKIFARRTDETSVYAVRPEDVRNLNATAWQFRDRRLWNFSENEVTRIVVKQRGITRELVRSGTNQWAFAPGSQGIINTFAVEETAHRLGELTATAWVDRGEANRARYGFGVNDGGMQIAFDVKRDAKIETFNLDFSAATSAHPAYGAVNLNGQTWIFECPPSVGAMVTSYLGLPGSTP